MCLSRCRIPTGSDSLLPNSEQSALLRISSDQSADIQICSNQDFCNPIFHISNYRLSLKVYSHIPNNMQPLLFPANHRISDSGYIYGIFLRLIIESSISFISSFAALSAHKTWDIYSKVLSRSLTNSRANINLYIYSQMLILQTL